MTIKEACYLSAADSIAVVPSTGIFYLASKNIVRIYTVAGVLLHQFKALEPPIPMALHIIYNLHQLITTNTFETKIWNIFDKKMPVNPFKPTLQGGEWASANDYKIQTTEKVQAITITHEAKTQLIPKKGNVKLFTAGEKLIVLNSFSFIDVYKKDAEQKFVRSLFIYGGSNSIVDVSATNTILAARYKIDDKNDSLTIYDITKKYVATLATHVISKDQKFQAVGSVFAIYSFQTIDFYNPDFTEKTYSVTIDDIGAIRTLAFCQEHLVALGSEKTAIITFNNPVGD